MTARAGADDWVVDRLFARLQEGFPWLVKGRLKAVGARPVPGWIELEHILEGVEGPLPPYDPRLPPALAGRVGGRVWRIVPQFDTSLLQGKRPTPFALVVGAHARLFPPGHESECVVPWFYMGKPGADPRNWVLPQFSSLKVPKPERLPPVRAKIVALASGASPTALLRSDRFLTAFSKWEALSRTAGPLSAPACFSGWGLTWKLQLAFGAATPHEGVAGALANVIELILRLEKAFGSPPLERIPFEEVPLDRPEGAVRDILPGFPCPVCRRTESASVDLRDAKALKIVSANCKAPIFKPLEMHGQPLGLTGMRWG